MISKVPMIRFTKHVHTLKLFSTKKLSFILSLKPKILIVITGTLRISLNLHKILTKKYKICCTT